MYHAGLITQLWTAALMRNSYEWIALSSGDCRNDRMSTPLISVLTGGHSSMLSLRPGSFVRRSWFCWTAHPDRLGQLNQEHSKTSRMAGTLDHHCMPQCCGMHPFSNLSEFLIISCSHKSFMSIFQMISCVMVLTNKRTYWRITTSLCHRRGDSNHLLPV